VTASFSLAWLPLFGLLAKLELLKPGQHISPHKAAGCSKDQP